MEFSVHDVAGRRFVEGAPGQPLVERVDDVRSIIEICFDNAAHALLLYPENLTARFFDLSSGEAGEILQRLRNYRIRLAIVRSPALQPSRRFAELLADEQAGAYFRAFDARPAAEEWLGSE